MCIRDVNLRVEGLSFSTFAPVDTIKRLFSLEVEIGFSGTIIGGSWAVASKIACFTETIGDEFHIRPQRLITIAAMVVRIKVCLIGPCNQCGSAR